jgi:hypothetical protein
MFAENKYSRWYFSIVNSARAYPREGYVEEHHIHPTSMGGVDTLENTVNLSAREHFIVHLLLPKMVIDKKHLMQMRKAIRFMMCVPKKMQGLRWIPTGRTFEIAKKEAALANKGNKDIAAKISASHKGKVLSEEHKRKISEGNMGRGRALASIEAQRGQPKSEHAKEKMRLAWIERRKRIAAGEETRKPMSEQGRKNISMGKLGKPATEEQKRKNGIAHTKLWQTPEHRAKVVQAQRNAHMKGLA